MVDDPFAPETNDTEESNAEADLEAQEMLGRVLNDYAEKFDQLRGDRHEAGAAEYGSFTFLGNDVTRMMIEELADTANYCTMQAIKLMLLQDYLADDLKDLGDKVEIGLKSFTGTKDIGWGKKE